jgi:MFS family permease
MARRAWFVLAAGAFLLTLNMGIRQSFGLFLEPMTVDLGWERTVFALALAVQNLIWGLAQPVFGVVAERYGYGRTLIGGAVLYVLGLIVMAEGTEPLAFELGAGLLVGCALAATGFPVVLAAVVRVFPPEQRSLALGIAGTGASLGQFALPPLSQGLISAYGWPIAYLILAALAGLILPLALPLAGRARPVHEEEGPASLGAALAEAARHSGFRYLCLGFFVCGFHVAFIATHLPVYVIGCGLPAMVGALALALIGFFNMVGSYVAGLLGGRYRKKYLLSGLYFGRAVVIAVFLWVPPSEASVLAFSAAMGLLWLGTVPLTSGLVGQIFGVRHLATLFGLVFLCHQIGAFLGAWLGGYIFDLTGSYDEMWLIAIGLGLLAAVVHWPIADRPVAGRLGVSPATG